MPPRVGSNKPAQTKTMAKASSSSKSSGSSKTSSSSGVKKATPPPAKPKNVDKVEFNKPKPTASAGTYKPTPPKPSKAELERIEKLKAIEEAKSALPAAIDKANKAYANLKEAIKEYDEAAETLRVHTKDAQENGFFSSNSSKLGALALIVGRIATRYTQFAEAGAPPLYAGGAAAVVGTIEGLLSDIMIYEIPDALQVENQIKDDAKNVDIANEKVMGATTLFTTAKTQLGYHIKEADGKNLDKLDDLDMPTNRQEIRRLFGV